MDLNRGAVTDPRDLLGLIASYPSGASTGELGRRRSVVHLIADVERTPANRERISLGSANNRRSSVTRKYGQHARDEGVQFRHVVAQELLGGFVGDLAVRGDEPRLELNVGLNLVQQR